MHRMRQSQNRPLKLKFNAALLGSGTRLQTFEFFFEFYKMAVMRVRTGAQKNFYLWMPMEFFLNVFTGFSEFSDQIEMS